MEKIIFSTIVGSQAYGTSTPQSDIDKKGVYMQSNDDILSFGYKPQYEVGKDECYYEVRRFLELLQTANPTVLEMLFMPQDCIQVNEPVFNLIIENRHKFLTKKCMHSFGGYAVAQIKKAKGLQKKMNWEATRVERKTPLDFCYAYEHGKTIPILEFLKKYEMQQNWCGLVALNHFKDCYALYYDISGLTKLRKPLGYHGIVLEDSNDIRLSSVPKEASALCIMYYNKDGYSMHCKDYREYQDWLKNRNTQRYVDIAGHNQQIDGKNLLHCRRLLDMAIEIATDKTISVRRPNADYLLKIRKGEVSLQEIINQAEKDIEVLQQLYEKSDLPNDCDFEFVNQLLIQIRNHKNEN